MPRIAWTTMLALSVLWGGSFLFNRLAVALAALALALAARTTGVAWPRRDLQRHHALRGRID